MRTLLALLAVVAVLVANAAHAGPFAPAPRVVAKYERDFIERSGAQTLEELLDTGIIRYFLTGGQPLLVLVNGRPYASTSSDLDSLPLSAIERIELLSGDTLGTLGGSAVRGAVNIVLRNDLDGVEVRAVARMPTRDGGDGWQGSAFWGGAVGEGRMTVGVDVLGREEIASRSREHSRSEWTEGGAFNETRNVSVGGNTVWVVDIEDDRLAGIRSVSLGECDPAKGYTGPLGDPPGPPVRPGDEGCGFAYGEIMTSPRASRAGCPRTSATTSSSTPTGWTVPWKATPSSTKAGSRGRSGPGATTSRTRSRTPARTWQPSQGAA